MTGSRTWTDIDAIRAALLSHSGGLQGKGAATLIHGACPDGADPMAQQIADEWDWTVERYPADWKRYGRAAGPIRNLQMVMTDPDICLAFIVDGSRGASGCALLAEEWGVKTVRYAP